MCSGVGNGVTAEETQRDTNLINTFHDRNPNRPNWTRHVSSLAQQAEHLVVEFELILFRPLLHLAIVSHKRFFFLAHRKQIWFSELTGSELDLEFEVRYIRQLVQATSTKC